jgi:DNA polymerase III subunit epsilon
MRVALARAGRRSVRSDVSAAYARASLPGRRTRWRDANWCAVDLELTGLDPQHDEIVSFGAIPIRAGRVQLHGAVSGLVRPRREISETSIRVHGIRAADLASAPLLREAIGPLLRAITGCVLVVHTAAVERAFLGRALREQGVRLRGPIADTEVLGRVWLHPGESRLRDRLPLGDLAAALGLPAERPHEALGDALTTAQAFIALATHLDALGPETVGSLARAKPRLEALRMFDPR